MSVVDKPGTSGGAPSAPTFEIDKPDTWPKEIRDRYLQKAQEASDAKKQLEERDNRIADYDRAMKGYEGTIASLTAQGRTTEPARRDDAAGVYTEEDIDPLDQRSVKRYVSGVVTRAQKELRDEWEGRAKELSSAVLQQASISDLLSMQYARILHHDSEADPVKLLEWLTKNNSYNMAQAYENVYSDKVSKRRQASEEERFQVRLKEELDKRAADAKKTPGNGEGTRTVLGPIGRVAAKGPEPRPKSYREATQQIATSGEIDKLFTAE